MRNFLAVMFLAVIGLGGAAPLHAAPPAPYVSVVKVTPGAAPARVLAFQNVSTGLAVVVRAIEVANASTMTVSGGPMQFWVYGSTQLTHSALTSADTWAYTTQNITQPAAVYISTAPTAIQVEGDTTVLAATGDLTSRTYPLIRPLVVNNDEAATANFYDRWESEAEGGLVQPLTLPAGSYRALVFEKRAQNGTDYTAGSVFIRIYYTLK